MSPDTLYVAQGGETHEVTPLGDGGQSVDSFYGYDQAEPASADTGLEQSGVSQMFFYEGSSGISLVFLHDEPDDGSGGSASVNLGSTPSGLSWVVKDNPFDSYSSTGASWNWAPCCTDGGAVRGGLDGEFRMSVSGSFSGIGSWQFRDASGGTFSLDTGEPVTLASREPETEFGDEIDFDFSVKNPIEQCDLQGAEKGEFGRKNCESRPSGKTPLLIYTDISFICKEILSFDIEGFEIELGDGEHRTWWVGVNPVTGCVWVGEEVTGKCGKIDCSVANTPEPVGLADLERIAEDAADWLENNTTVAAGAVLVAVIVVALAALFVASPGIAVAGAVAAALGLGGAG